MIIDNAIIFSNKAMLNIINERILVFNSIIIRSIIKLMCDIGDFN
jgi:hypothetical protein